MNVLVVEDNPVDQAIILSTLRDCGKPITVSVAATAEQALAIIDDKKDRRVARFDLVLLDLDLDKTNGQTVLSAMRKSQHHRATPVVVFTTSKDKANVENCWRMRANWYVVKPLELDAFESSVKRVIQYWWSLFHERQGSASLFPGAVPQEFFVEGVAFP